MDGFIEFDNIEDLARFLRAFTGSTAKFEVVKKFNIWRLTFTGGY
jgi:hypothetical protein